MEIFEETLTVKTEGLQINDLIDFTFVYNELSSKYCQNNGRTAESPIRMFKYLLLKVIYNISDKDVVERSKVDMLHIPVILTPCFGDTDPLYS